MYNFVAKLVRPNYLASRNRQFLQRKYARSLESWLRLCAICLQNLIRLQQAAAPGMQKAIVRIEKNRMRSSMLDHRIHRYCVWHLRWALR
jgi:hypothetical protein